VAKHLEAIRARAPETEAAYRAMGQVCLAVAEEKGLSPAKANEIARLLKPAGYLETAV
jgi:hypothetical protein